MAQSVSIKKHFGVVYTPDFIVKFMLEKLSNLSNVSICDPACGNGQFLAAIVEQICQKINECTSQRRIDEYYQTLHKLTGFDIDEQVLNECRGRLDRIVEGFGCKKIKWRLKIADAIDRRSWLFFSGQFDAIITNPPYVRIQHLEESRRNAIAGSDWKLMQGCSDLYILFMEMGLELLRQNGRLIYITPNTWMKTQSGNRLREYLRTKHRVVSIVDFGAYQVFKNATTYSAITEVLKGGRTGRVQGFKCTGVDVDKLNLIPGQVNPDTSTWSVLTDSEEKFMREAVASRLTLADVASIHVGIQTLKDKVFIVSQSYSEQNYFESDVTRRILKASAMRNGRDSHDRVIIYPYRNGVLIAENEMRSSYPNTYRHLKRHKILLLQRDKGAIPEKKWYGYGREVSITSGFGDKILTSGLNLRPNFQRCFDRNSLFYNGYCIKPLDGVSIDELLDQLNSKRMEEYIRLVSRPYQNGWFSYAKSFIQSFPIKETIYA